MRVLLVDDDPSIRGLLSFELTSSGHEVDVAEDGHEALAAIRSNRPDAVVLDVMMPILSGWDVLTELRADDELRRLPVVLLSARDVPDDVRHGYELGASLVLPKPFDGPRLVGLLESLTANAASLSVSLTSPEVEAEVAAAVPPVFPESTRWRVDAD